MKILHCADIHLDSPLGSNLSGEQAKMRNNEILITFMDMVKYAASNGVEIVIIAGDLFDSEAPSQKTAELLSSCIGKYPDIDFLYLKGNHDGGKKIPGLDALANFKEFDAGICAFRYGGVCITGISDVSMYKFLKLNPEDINIVALHGDVVQKKIFSGLNIDYVAAGHIHRHSMEKIDERGVFCYSGCLEPRGFDECGDTGFIIVETIDEAGDETQGLALQTLKTSGIICAPQIKAAFMPFGRRKAHCIEFKADKTSSTSSLCIDAEKRFAGIPAGDMVKMQVVGEVTAEQLIDYAYIEKYFEKDFFCFRIEDKTKIVGGAEDKSGMGSFGNKFVELVMNSGETEENKKYILRKGIEALKGLRKEVR